MTMHIEKFSEVTSKVLDLLYNNFPIPVDVGLSDAVTLPNLREMAMRNSQSLEEAEASFSKVSEAVDVEEEWRQIFIGTMDFLAHEGFIRFDQEYSEAGLYRYCQLTSKGFTHLHMEFKDKTLGGESWTVIRWIKERFANSTNIESALVLSVITKFLS